MESVSIRVNVLRKTFRRKFQSTSKLDDESDFGTDSSEQFAKANSSKYDSSQSLQSNSSRFSFRGWKALRSKMDVNGEGGESLATFLESIGLSHYHNAIKNELKVETMQQLRQVEEQDLEDIRMRSDDIAKLKKNIKKEFPQSAFGKLKKRLTRSSSDQQTMRNSRSSVLSTTESEAPKSPVPVVGRRIIPREQIDIQNDIGEGEFGVVRHAVYTNDIGQKIEVAVKSLSRDRLEHGLQEFLKEASSMQSVSHSNIVTFYGIVFQQEKELMLVTEYAPMKSLLECLHNDSLRVTLSVSRLSAFAHQIATGMTYLEAQGLIHRDLAARNILVFSDKKVKIGDFGLSRALGLEKEYYQSKYRTDLKIPIAWCAPECINLLRFSSASDVWAFGVTMWEMFTYGKKPWDGLTSMEILKTIDNPKRQRLERPELCPTEHYALMMKCWSHEPEERPKFAAIVSELTSIKPTIMKATRSSTSAPGCISFIEGDSITVIDKKPHDAPTWQYWLGVNKAGERGFFNPTECVPVMPESSPLTTRSTKSLQAPPKKSMKKQTSSRSPRNQEKKKFTADMIGAPQDDLRHTGHIGYDGIKFGDIPVSADKVDKIIPVKGGSSGSSTLRSTTSEGSGSAITGASISVGPNAVITNGGTHHINDTSRLTVSPPPPPVTALAVPIINSNTAGNHSLTVNSNTTTSSYTTASADSTDGGLQDLEDFEFPDLSLSESLGDFGTSFIDDMMREFKTGTYANKNENNNSSKQLETTSASLRQQHNGGSSDGISNNVLPGPNLKSMSASDEKMINDAIELANQLASTSLSQANTPRDLEEEPGTPSKSKHRFHFKFPGTKKTSPKTDKRSFSDDLASKSDTSTVTPEAEQAYNLLVAKGTSRQTNSQSVEDIQIAASRKAANGKPPEPPSNPPSRTRRHSSNSQHRPNSRTSVKSTDRPKERPPLPPIQIGDPNDRSEASYHDDLSDMPCTPPPPVPKSPTSRLPHTPSIEAVYNNMEAFWGEDVRPPVSHTAPDNTIVHQGKYKSRSDNVSYEDLLEFSEERQQLRRIQKIIGNEVSEAECLQALEKTQGDTNNALKYIKLKQLAKLKLAGIDQCKTALVRCQWNVQRAADFILDHKAVYQNDVIGV